MSAVDAVFLDAGGVLLLPDHAQVRTTLAPFGCEPGGEVIDRALYASSAALDSWPDEVDDVWEEADRAFAHAAGVPEEHFEQAVTALGGMFRDAALWTRPVPGGGEAIRALRDAGVAVVVVSNSDGRVEEYLREASICQVGPGHLADVTAVVDSHHVGVAKPDPRIFEIALAAAGVGPDRALHVGDIVGADVAGARAAGVRPIHFDPHGFCEADDHEDVVSLTQVVDVAVS
jgi:putative hydrolase of the HAD superfamily